MKLQFKIQPHQTAAVDAVVDCFAGQPRSAGLLYRIDPGKRSRGAAQQLTGLEDSGFRNAEIALAHQQLLDNIRGVQRAANLPKSSALSSSRAAHVDRPDVPNLTVEMETGTGKTYVYIKTMMELHQRYGWSKFIVVVPSVAIREGVKQTFDSTAEHFQETYGKRPRAFVYNSSRLHDLESFSSDTGVQVMIINTQAFNATGKDQRRIYDELDDFQSRRPIDVIRANRPIVIIDEPQRLGIEFDERTGKPVSKGRLSKTLASLSRFDPLAILRYSATHKPQHEYNKVHRLDAVDAYNLRLVKKIGVRGISVRGLAGSTAYLYLEAVEVRSGAGPRARVELEIQTKTGIKRQSRYVDHGTNLYDLSGGLEAYRGLFVTDVDAIRDVIALSNGDEIAAGEITADVTEETKRRIQIREVVRAHLDKERRLHARDIKVLSLFFIDEVAKYRDYSREDARGEYARIFEEEYREAVQEERGKLVLDPATERWHAYLDAIAPEATHQGYFSIDKKSKHFVDPAVAARGEGAGEATDVDAYDLILRNKELLLSFDSAVRFLFSHSALREGWDNPNVFVMGMLKRSDNTVSRRQEIGRGLRLAVDQQGERVDDPLTVHDINELTVVTDESYEEFARGLQHEMSETVSARPRRADQDYFAGKLIGGGVQIDEQLARDIYKYLVKNDYLNDDDTIAESFKEARERDDLATPTSEALATSLREVVPLIEALYLEVPRAGNDRKAKALPFNEANFKRREFQELWKRINHKSIYQVDFDSAELVKNCVRELDRHLHVAPLQYVVAEGAQRSTLDVDELRAGRSFEDGQVRTETETQSAGSQVPYDLLGEIADQTRLTRRTICGILQGVTPVTFRKFAQNPEQFIAEASRLINEQKATVIVEHLSYDTLESTYDSSIFTANQSTQDFTNAGGPLTRSVYDYVVTDSKQERSFVEALEKSAEVAVYAKLPRGFFIPTPVGNYNPDWAIAFQEGAVRHIYFVAETKGSLSSLQLRGVEEAKIECARKFFEDLTAKAGREQVKYDVVTDYARLMELVA